MRWCIDASSAAKSKRDGPASGASNEEMKKKKKKKGISRKGRSKGKNAQNDFLACVCRLANSLAHLSSSGGTSLPHVKRRFSEYNFNHVVVVFEKSEKFPTCFAVVS